MTRTLEGRANGKPAQIASVQSEDKNEVLKILSCYCEMLCDSVRVRTLCVRVHTTVQIGTLNLRKNKHREDTREKRLLTLIRGI